MGSRQRRSICLVAWLGTLAVGASAGIVRYVDDSAPPGGDGVSWDTAYRYLQDALFITGPGDEIRVAGGLYWPDRDQGGYLTPGDRHASFWLLDGEFVRGGYAGYGTANPNARNVALHETVLTGDLLSNDEPGFVNITDNSFHVVTIEGAGIGSVLDGVTIRAGNANASYPDDRGGGLLALATSPYILHCTFTGNWAAFGGGAAFAGDDTIPEFADCHFFSNASAVFGGALYVGLRAFPYIDYCVFEDNTAAAAGGAVFADDQAAPWFSDCAFAYNGAPWGGAVHNDAECVPHFTDCEFVNNAATTLSGGAVFNNDAAAATFIGCVFSGNTAQEDGGAILNDWWCTALFADCHFTGNVAARHAGAIGNWHGVQATLTDCVLSGNVAVQDAGALLNDWDALATLQRCTLTQNVANNGGGINNWGTARVEMTDCELTYNHANTNGGGLNSSGNDALTRCRFEGNTADSRGAGAVNWNGVPTFTDSDFVANAATDLGGGILFDHSHATLDNCAFRQNTAGNAGGAVFDFWQSTLAFTDCTFDQNVAPWGAGLSNDNLASAVLTRCQFLYNTASGGGGGMSNWQSSPVLVECDFVGNSATWGGGLRNVGDATAPALNGCTFVNNRADDAGGGVCNADSASLTMDHCTLTGNTSASAGGGVYSRNSGLTITHGWFTANSSRFGGALFLQDGSGQFGGCVYAGNQARGGGAIYVQAAPVTLTNCTLTQNTGLEYGGALWGGGGSTAFLLANCIAWENEPDTHLGGTFAIWTRHCAIEATWPGEDNIHSDPRFVDPGADYHLQPDSPCIEHGDNEAPQLPALDMDGQPRIQQCQVDIGADESPYYFDCNANGLLDCVDIAQGTSLDCNLNDIPDECDLAGQSSDCNANGVPDECDLASGLSWDCNENGTLDECDLAQGSSQDCNANQVLDECELEDGTATDVNGNGLLDECEGLGDLNCDQLVDFDDIIPFVLALSDPLTYAAAFPDCDAQRADCNGDGGLGFDDISALVWLLSSAN